MNIILHFPKAEQDKQTLRDQIAQVHASAVIRHIDQLACSREQKLKLICSVQREYLL